MSTPKIIKSARPTGRIDRTMRPKRPPLRVSGPPGHRFRIRFIMLAVAFVVTQMLPIAPQLVQAASCADLEVIFARGSGEELDSESYRAWQTSIASELADFGDELTIHYYELGSAVQGGYQYPAVTVAGSLAGFINLGGAAISGGNAFAFGRSVDQGVLELQSYVSTVSTACPKTRFVLGGYSQGAMVITYSLPLLDPSKIAYAATFGDPKLYLPEGKSIDEDNLTTFHIPEACFSENLSEYRAYVPDCRAYKGILGAQVPYQPLGYTGKLGTWCNEKDIICSSGMSISDHLSYVSNHLYEHAAIKIKAAVKAAFIDRLPDVVATEDHIHEVAFLIDSTSSMMNLYTRLSSEARSLAKQVIDSGGRIALFTYRDLAEGFATTKLCDFTCTLDEFNQQLSNIQLGYGDDDNESALSGMKTTINSLNWTDGTTKSLLLLTESGAHDPDLDGVTSDDVLAASQAQGGVRIFTAVWQPNMASYANLATASGGQVFNLASGIEQTSAAILPSPTVTLKQHTYTGPNNINLTFDASSAQVFAGNTLTFDWDLDGDGIFELSDAGPMASAYYKQFNGNISVKVTDMAGHSAIDTASVVVNGSFAIEKPVVLDNIQISLASTFSARSTAGAELTFTTDASHILLVTNDGILGFVDLADGTNSLQFAADLLDSFITLIPYSASGQRGVSQTIQLSADPESDDPELVIEPTINTDAETRPSPGPVLVGTTTNSSPSSTVIPKAPNTGVRSLTKKEVLMSNP